MSSPLLGRLVKILSAMDLGSSIVAWLLSIRVAIRTIFSCRCSMSMREATGTSSFSTSLSPALAELCWVSWKRVRKGYLIERVFVLPKSNCFQILFKAESGCCAWSYHWIMTSMSSRVHLTVLRMLWFVASAYRTKKLWLCSFTGNKMFWALLLAVLVLSWDGPTVRSSKNVEILLRLCCSTTVLRSNRTRSSSR